MIKQKLTVTITKMISVTRITLMLTVEFDSKRSHTAVRRINARPLRYCTN